MIEISASAQTYLTELLANQEGEDTAIRVFVAQPGTPQAETCIAYCQKGEEQDGDVAVDSVKFDLCAFFPCVHFCFDFHNVLSPDCRVYQQ